MGLQKSIVITALIIFSLASGYLKGRPKFICLAILGVILGFYAVEYMNLGLGL